MKFSLVMVFVSLNRIGTKEYHEDCFWRKGGKHVHVDEEVKSAVKHGSWSRHLTIIFTKIFTNLYEAALPNLIVRYEKFLNKQGSYEEK